MAPQNASIQSFFAPSSSSITSAPQSSPGDGFTTSEIQKALEASKPGPWVPDTDYEEFTIGDLLPGPRHVTFSGRIANLNDAPSPSYVPKPAKGNVRLTLVDDTGSIIIRLCYARYLYELRLGQLVTVWATRVSIGNCNNFVSTFGNLHISMFPEREKSCHLEVVTDPNRQSELRVPMGIEACDSSQKLMTMKSYVEGGWEVSGAKIIVLVKSIGTRKKMTNKDGSVSELVNVGVCDDSEEASLSLWGVAAPSAASWVPSHTVLLITDPGCNASRRNWLSLAYNSMVEVDPDVQDTAWLRRFATRFAKREHVNPPFPVGVDRDAIVTSPTRVLYTLAELDDRVREAPTETFAGYLTLVVLELKFVTLCRRRMLLCAECCGVPLYANVVRATCKQCDREVQLRLNPQVIGTLIDETGCIGQGKLILSDMVCERLMGSALVDMTVSIESMRAVEARLLYSRVNLIFYWSRELGRLAIVDTA